MYAPQPPILITGGALETRGTLTVKEGPSSVQLIITIFVALTVIRVTNAGNWFHYGHVEITTTVFIAVAVQGGTWNQFGSSRITTGSGRVCNSGFGLDLDSVREDRAGRLGARHADRERHRPELIGYEDASPAL
ncbi:tetratricopeptide repeat domain containing protein [Acanthamoeba castellanii str. Neff]|uniref:Tetratricopeptide repeat domain containing protein n=1 Tax=Acanthamoeba castellanii (strain ATCC 30010 / Neff) TaxID=1257118 RepID=L8HG46_ACACF|nr:tetratricopeptide repeat domain containing protein [Acanthamoeba castellanii str. Neff]ELR23421.1 tetratricopeptide repeat domain containing protein [Acanthamoeba castellanii str. Neff]